MAEMKTVNQVAKLSGVSVRTLHYYDEIGLLTPTVITAAGYRLYDGSALDRLQQILFYRELDFSLSDIRRILDDPAFDRMEALNGHRALLQLKKERLDRLIGLVDSMMKGEKDMSFAEFDQTAIEKARAQYAKEVEERWGGTQAYRESRVKTDAYGKEEWAEAQKEADAIFQDFAAHQQEDPGSPEVQKLVSRWQEHITRRYYACTNDILSGLGTMYTADPRFTENIDRYGEGLASFMGEAIRIYCSSHQ